MAPIAWSILVLVMLLRQSMGSQVQVVNKCTFPIHLRADQLDEPEIQRVQPGGTYRAAYRNKVAYNPATGADSAVGVSIKISADSRLRNETGEDLLSLFRTSPVTQLEYTFDPTLKPGPDLYYDLSDIDDSSPRQFCKYGLALVPQRNSCTPVVCPPDCERNCSSVYNYPSDDFATRGCESNVGLTLFLCSGS